MVEVYDQNILLQHTLDGHKREVVDMAVSPELLVTISKDMQVFTWSTKTKVRYDHPITICHPILAGAGLLLLGDYDSTSPQREYCG